jgi:hypothetical protein
MACSDTTFSFSKPAVDGNSHDKRNELRFAVPLKLSEAADVCCQVLESANMRYSVYENTKIVCVSNLEVLERPLRIEISLRQLHMNQSEVAIRVAKSALKSFLERLVRLQQFNYLHAHIEALALKINKANASFLSKAENPDTHPFTLMMLADFPSADVRTAVADNPSTPHVALVKLVIDDNPDVRYALAENHNVRIELLKQLALDDNPYVSARASQTLTRIFNEAKANAIQLQKN